MLASPSNASVAFVATLSGVGILLLLVSAPRTRWAQSTGRLFPRRSVYMDSELEAELHSLSGKTL